MRKKYIGIMTGTSVDAIDLAYAEFDTTEDEYINVISVGEYPFSDKLQKYIKGLTTEISLKNLSQLNIAYTNEIARAIEQFISDRNIEKEKVEAIGLHGQTLWHQPTPEEFLGNSISSTYQLGSGTHLSATLGIDVVSDFRTADISLGGQGAPLVPIFDFAFLKEEDDTIVLNIGGIANITYLKSLGGKSDIIAFDTGPGNCLIDLVCYNTFGINYDKNGNIAKSGNLDEILLGKLMSEPYITAAYPKSTGKELFNGDFIKQNGGFELLPEDLLCTLTHFTAKSIAANIEKICKNEFILKIAGGGAKNSFLVELIGKYCKNARIEEIAIAGQSIADSREALLMAYLAHLRYFKKPANIPSVTGAKRECILGAISISR